MCIRDSLFPGLFVRLMDLTKYTTRASKKKAQRRNGGPAPQAIQAPMGTGEPRIILGPCRVTTAMTLEDYRTSLTPEERPASRR